jgi:hypothetical protein
VLAGAAAIPTVKIGGSDALAMMALGAGAALFAVLGGWFVAKLAFRGPDRFATKLVVGGFLVRLILLFLTMTVLVLVTGVQLSRFVLWLVSFYFAMLMAEAWILARNHVSESEEGPTR